MVFKTLKSFYKENKKTVGYFMYLVNYLTKIATAFLLSLCSFEAVYGQLLQAQVSGYGKSYYNNIVRSSATPAVKPTEIIVFEPTLSVYDKLHFSTELEVVHNILSNGTYELVFNQAFFEYFFNNEIGVKAGIVNPYHEDIHHNGVNHPMIDEKIMLTGWKGASVGIFGRLDNLNMELLIIQSMNQNMIPEYQPVSSSQESKILPKADGLGAAARMEYTINERVSWIGNYYYSDVTGYWGVNKSSSLHVAESSISFKKNGFQSKGAGAIHVITGSKQEYSGTLVNPTTRIGAYLEFGYELNDFVGLADHQSLIVFTRNEVYDASYSIPDPALATKTEVEYTVGLNYYINQSIIIKGDFQRNYITNELGQTHLNLGITYTF